jgi:drug/metabolite transporter (DMT)-like permease
VTVLLGLLASLCYGVSDFGGGMASRRESASLRHSAITILTYSYPVGAVLMLGLLPFFPGHLTVHVVVFGIFGGLSGMVGVVLMYQLMITSPMNVISPVTAVLAAIVPVLAGVVIGERPAVAAWIGIVVGGIAVVLCSRTSEENAHGRIALRVLLLAFVSGSGFGLYFVFLSQAGTHDGLWPVVISRLTSSVLILPLAAKRRAFARITGRTLAITIAAGALDASANMFFLLATHTGLLSLAGVLTALYPAVTVLLAVGVLHEHTSRLQRAGLGLAAAAVVLITI